MQGIMSVTGPASVVTYHPFLLYASAVRSDRDIQVTAPWHNFDLLGHVLYAKLSGYPAAQPESRGSTLARSFLSIIIPYPTFPTA